VEYSSGSATPHARAASLLPPLLRAGGMHGRSVLSASPRAPAALHP
jgi:hypothetical protein